MEKEPSDIEEYQATEELEPTIDTETSSMMEPPSALTCRVTVTPPPQYWKAQAIAAAIHRQFETLKQAGDVKGMRRQFYVLAHYYGRTLGVLRQALAHGREPLITAALENLASLHQPLHHMHDIAPTNVPFVLTLDRQTRKQLIRDGIIKVLAETQHPLKLPEIAAKIGLLHLFAEVPTDVLTVYLGELIGEEYLSQTGATYLLTRKAYPSTNLDRAGLQAFLGEDLYNEFRRHGFAGVSNIVNRKDDFFTFFRGFANCGQPVAEAFLTTAVELLGPPSHAPELHPWRHADLIGSLRPRPYQYAAFSIFRRYGYQAKVLEAPSGSGKTMVGMMCVQDWLRSMSPGESILVLVPTVNYRQQWVAELSYNPAGLQMSPEDIFSGTIADLGKSRSRTGSVPPLLVMTYAALAGLDRPALEDFFSAANVRYIILDEVHKIADNPQGSWADLTRSFAERLRQAKLQGLIGFSGTAAAYRDRFPVLGLELIYIIPAADLIAHGFVAPFAEFGIPFTYSSREIKVRDLLERYKLVMNRYLAMIDIRRLVSLLAGIPAEKRMSIARDLLQLYAGDPDQADLIGRRLERWRGIIALNLNELPLLYTVQIASNLSDEALAGAVLPPAETSAFREILKEADDIRQHLKNDVVFPDIRARLDAAGFGRSVDFGDLLNTASTRTAAGIKDLVKDRLAATVFGLYLSLKDFYYRLGEGHIECIKAIINAEKEQRRVTGVIIFDNARHLHKDGGRPVAEYAGTGGLFLHLLGESSLTPIAATSSEIYLPWSRENPLNRQISDFIKHEVILEVTGGAIFDLVTFGLRISPARLAGLRAAWRNILEEYTDGLADLVSARTGDFKRRVLSGFRKVVKESAPPAVVRTLRSRLDIRNHHLYELVGTFFDYALLAGRFLKASEVELETPDLENHRFFVVNMPISERNQLMYDLLARIVNSDKLPVNVVIVSTWARTGWNVHAPNVLIDATATRDTIAWQQLRGRAMRAAPGWDSHCSELLMHILGSYLGDMATIESVIGPDELLTEILQREFHVAPGRDEKRILKEVARHYRETRDHGISRLPARNIESLTTREKIRLATGLMLARNKVTHIYELVRAYGSASQVVYDRSSRSWRRSNSVGRKHSQEYSVSPLSGDYRSGEDHAPLVYYDDPRKDWPRQVQQNLAARLGKADRRIVEGWIKTMLSESSEKT